LVERRILGRVAGYDQQAGVARPLQGRRMHVDHHQRAVLVMQLGRDLPPHAAVSADDKVIADLHDLPFHPLPLPALIEFPFEHPADHHAERVDDAAHADEDQRDSEDPPPRRKGVDLAQSRRSSRS
jgi:hypothetical protein